MRHFILGCLFSCLFVVSACLAEEPLRGPLPEGQRNLIHHMALHQDQIHREVEVTEDGYVAVTTSNDPDLVLMLHEHVRYMEKRMKAGAPVRRWDPAFVEMREHYRDLRVRIENLDDGVRVRVRGKTEAARKVARNHAGIITAFLAGGMQEVQEPHDRVLD